MAMPEAVVELVDDLAHPAVGAEGLPPRLRRGEGLAHIFSVVVRSKKPGPTAWSKPVWARSVPSLSK